MGELITQSEREPEFNLQVSELSEMAGRCAVLNDIDLEKAGDLGKFIKTAYKKIEDERTAIVKPFNDGVKAINARFKEMTAPLEKAEKLVKAEMVRYMTEREAAQRAEQLAKRQAEAEAALALAAQQEVAGDELAASQSLESAVVIESREIQTAATPTRGDFGSTSSMRKTWTFSVDDLQKLAASRPDLIMPNDKAIRAAIASGDREIAGLNIYQENSVAIR